MPNCHIASHDFTDMLHVQSENFLNEHCKKTKIYRTYCHTTHTKQWTQRVKLQSLELQSLRVFFI